MGDATVLMVAQRVSSVIEADQILVLEHGALVGIGRHDELMESCDTYVEIVESQLPTEDVA
jgi:ATP-binding cassette subfamily B multidrug efflux pump